MDIEKTESQAYWLDQIARSELYFKDWWSRGDKLNKLYSNQRSSTDKQRRFAMLWANVEVLKPATYSRPPKPQLSRKFKDKDPIGRIASELLERCSGSEFDRMGVDFVLRKVRDDLLLPGRGVAWVRLEGKSLYNESEEQGEVEEKNETCIDYIHYKQFLHSPARNWREVTWVAKKTYLSKKQGEKRFGDKWKNISMDNPASDNQNENPDKGKSLFLVYEIWSKADKQVYYVAQGANDVLEKSKPPINFEHFFPCPQPVYATLVNDSLIPTPDYVYYQDQAEEVDTLTKRIASLSDSLKLVGFYPLGADGKVSAAIETALNAGTENRMIGVESWAAFMDKGGTGSIQFLPIRDVVEVLRALIELRSQLIQDSYQINGISDVVRGASNPNETATAQNIKNQWGSIRIRDRQQELVRFALDLVAMTCEVIAEHYDLQEMLTMANVELPQMQPLPPPPQQLPPPQQGQEEDPAYQQAAQQNQQEIEQYQQMAQAAQAAQKANQQMQAAFELLRNEKMRNFRIDIETDSTLQPDEDADKQRRTEFVSAVGGLLQQAVPTIQAIPEMAPLIGEMLLFTVRGFRAGRGMEDQIETTMQALQEKASASAGQPAPDPVAMKLQADQQIAQAKAQSDIQFAQMKADSDSQIAQMKAQLDLQLMKEKGATELEISKAKAEIDLQAQQEKARVQMEIDTMNAQHKNILTEKSHEHSTILENHKAGLVPGEKETVEAQFRNDIQEALDGIIKLQQSSQEMQTMIMQLIANGNNELRDAITAPKTVTTPDGRVYTSKSHATLN